jgi:nucleotide-binding universal stress UspA family protein
MGAEASPTIEPTSHGVVVGYDGSPGARLALEWAIETARRDDRPLTLVHCVGLSMTPAFRAYDPGVHVHAYEELSHGVLTEAIEIASKELDRNDIRPLSATGNTSAELVRVSPQADLLVTGSRGHGTISSGLLGSTSYAVTAHAQCPAVVVRGPSVIHAGRSHPVVVAFDDSRPARTALRTAIQVAAAAEAQLHVVSVDNVGGLEAWPETDTVLGREEVVESMHRQVEKSLRDVVDETARAHPGLDVRTGVVTGPAGRAIAGYADDVEAGLIVMGSRGHGGFTGMLLGSVSHRVIHDAPCPVMVMH